MTYREIPSTDRWNGLTELKTPEGRTIVVCGYGDSARAVLRRYVEGVR